MQIRDQFAVFGQPIDLRTTLLMGGVGTLFYIHKLITHEDPIAQALELARKPHIIIGSPGRIFDHIASHNLNLDRLKYLV